MHSLINFDSEGGKLDRTREPLVPSISLRDLTFIVSKHKWGAATVLLTAALAGFIWIWFVRDDVYQVTARVLVRLGQEQAPPTTLVGQGPMVIGYRSQDVNTELDILQSRDLLAQVSDHFGLDKPQAPRPVPQKFVPKVRYYAKRTVRRIEDWCNDVLISLGVRERLSPRERAIAELQKNITAIPQRESNVVVVSAMLPAREGSGFFLNTLLDFYQRFRLGVYRDHSGVPFFKNEADKSYGRLRSAEQQLQAYEQASDISQIDSQERELLSQIARQRTAVHDSEIAYKDADAKLARLETQLQAPEPDFANLGEFDRDSFPQNLLRQLSVLQQQREDLRMTLLDKSDRVRNNRDQFRVVLGLLASNVRSVAEERKAVFQSRSDELHRLQAALDGVHSRQMGVADLKRKVGESEASYLFNRKKLEEATAAGAMEREHIGNVSIVEHAVDAVQPIGLRKTTLFGLVLLAGLMLALAWIALAEFFDDRVYTGSELELSTGMPVLGVVPESRVIRISGQRAAIRSAARG